ncbi:ArsC/Spx/MgsR family protein [Palleronia abyssalis]|uniref:Regulatory protein Spx n=1 Tax=Palleronia abyssalis TaxID=1501240 RepID=A0A2R8BYS5_9RHOB|nr:ArsC/Spx/MgsR family protein [Palleronia abyssalis]SPJ25318.1 Regulatory protein Spx [Palleronia abyssalis]
MKLYGLKTCDTCRKALTNLKNLGFDVEFVDIRADPLPQADLERFAEAFGDDLLNRRSTTWRGLSEDQRQMPPVQLVATYPAVMKRPVIERGDQLYLGWSSQVQARIT